MARVTPSSHPAKHASPDSSASTASSGLRHAIARHRGLAMHTFILGVVAIDLIALNVITNRQTIWAVWPIGIWAVVLAAHAGATLVKPPVFGAHLAGGGAICLGLAIINVFHGHTVWFIWPTLAWLVSLGLHAPFAFDHLRERSHRIARRH